MNKNIEDIAITITARLDNEFFKGRFSSSGLESIEKIIKEELTTFESQIRESEREKERGQWYLALVHLPTEYRDSVLATKDSLSTLSPSDTLEDKK